MKITVPSASLFAFLCLSAPFHAHADFAATLCTLGEPGRATLESETPGVCTGFTTRDERGNVIQRVSGEFVISGSMLATPDGRSVFVIQDYPRLSGSRNAPETEIPGVIVYRDGKRVASYSIARLLQRSSLVQSTVSHFSWLRDFDVRGQDLGPTLVLNTLSLRELVFDTATGELLAENDSVELQKCDVAGWGHLRNGNQNRGANLHFVPHRLAKGQIDAKGISVLAKNPIREGYQGVCLRRGQNGHILVPLKLGM